MLVTCPLWPTLKCVTDAKCHSREIPSSQHSRALNCIALHCTALHCLACSACCSPAYWWIVWRYLYALYCLTTVRCCLSRWFYAAGSKARRSLYEAPHYNANALRIGNWGYIVIGWCICVAAESIARQHTMSFLYWGWKDGLAWAFTNKIYHQALRCL